jgi:hypothetical protein
MKRIFISSVQKEFSEERRALRDFIQGEALLRRYFSVFLFEDLPATTLYLGASGQYSSSLITSSSSVSPNWSLPFRSRPSATWARIASISPAHALDTKALICCSRSPCGASLLSLIRSPFLDVAGNWVRPIPEMVCPQGGPTFNVSCERQQAIADLPCSWSLYML